jgi:hypothetical protein
MIHPIISNRFIAVKSGATQSATFMTEESKSLFILVAGPYRSNTGDNPEKIAQNLRTMNEAAVELFRAGHLPITGEAIALPLIETAGSRQIGDAIFNEFFHPISHRLVERVDVVLRVGGPSAGADKMVEAAKAEGKPALSLEQFRASAQFQAGNK